MKFGSTVDVSAFPSTGTAVNHPVALDRLVGEMEHLVGDGEAENAKRKEREDEPVVDRMLQGLRSNVMDVERENRNDKEVVRPKSGMGKGIIAVPR